MELNLITILIRHNFPRQQQWNDEFAYEKARPTIFQTELKD